MAVRIRLMRLGSKRRPFYRFVVADSRGKRDGGFLDQVGYYNPIERPQEIQVDEDKVFEWLTKGAQLSDGARSLLRKTGTLARWDAKRTGREAPQKTLPTEEATIAATPPEKAVSEEATEEKAVAAGTEEAEAVEKPVEEAPGKEPASEDTKAQDVSTEGPAEKEEPAAGEA